MRRRSNNPADALTSWDGWWILSWWCLLVEDRRKLCPWRSRWSIADISADDGCGYGWAVYLWWAKCWRNNRLFLWGSVDFSETVICFWKLRMFQKSLDFIFVEVLGISKSPGEYDVFYTFDLEGMAKFILDMNLSMYREKWMSCRKGVWKFVPLWGATWHWCDLTFIEPSVVKLDYGKVSTTGLSSFGIPLRYTELQEMIWDIDLWVWVNLHGAQATLNTVWSFI